LGGDNTVHNGWRIWHVQYKAIDVPKHVPMRFVKKRRLVFHGKHLTDSFVFEGNEALSVLTVSKVQQVSVRRRITRDQLRPKL
jgi:hypothetical protein